MVLAVLVLLAWTPGPHHRALLLLTAAAVPWLVYLGVLAYVEGGTLFFAALAAALLFHSAQQEDRASRSIAAAGLCAGLAGGCKYIAMAQVTVALPLAWCLTSLRTPRRVLVGLPVFLLTALVALSPWLIRNCVFTGNPVYPFAYRLFGGRAWSAEQAEQWEQGHTLPAEQQSVSARLRLAGSELFGRFRPRSRAFEPSLFGPLVWLLAAMGVLRGRSRERWPALLWLGLMLLVWGVWTHMPGRFAVPAVVPLLWLAAQPLPGSATQRRVVVAVTFLAAVLGNIHLARLLQRHDRWWRQRVGVPLRELAGTTEFFREAHPLNRAVPPDGFIWMIGDAAPFYVDRRLHYTVVFGRDPWLAYAAEGRSPAECVEWLRRRGVTHVWFVWSEIYRLRDTYGFPHFVTREWVRGLVAAGLEPVALDAPGTSGELYRVPR